MLAYKGFTTITNQGDDILDPKKNIARSIVISLLICTVLYLLVTVSVESSIGAKGAVGARDYALAQAAEPLFGAWGVGITVAIAVVAALGLPCDPVLRVTPLRDVARDATGAVTAHKVTHQPMIITAGLAIVATAFMGLSQIASMGAILYLFMDIAVQWGVIRHLRAKIDAKPWLPALTIALDLDLDLDLAILVPFTVSKVQNDTLTVIVAASVAAAIVIAQVSTARVRARQE